MKKQRYLVTMDFFIYEDGENQAIEKAEAIAKAMRKEEDNYASIISIYESPFGARSVKNKIK